LTAFIHALGDTNVGYKPLTPTSVISRWHQPRL